MIKNLQYLYLGENGSILSPVKLTEIHCVKKYRLIAEANHKLTKAGKHLYSAVTIPESDINLWYEVKDNGQN